MQKAILNARPEIHFSLLPEMQRGLAFLEMPLFELESAIREEALKNPLLECEEPLFKEFKIREGGSKSSFIEGTLPIVSSLYENLIRQSKEIFHDFKDQKIAAQIIGNLDEAGILKISISEISDLAKVSACEIKRILTQIQEFEPAGIGATSIQEAFIIQLKRKGKEKTLGFEIIKNEFSLLLENKLLAISKNLKVPLHEVRKALFEIRLFLDSRPGAQFSRGHYKEEDPFIIPDLTLCYEGESFSLSINNNYLPRIKINQILLEKLKAQEMKGENRLFLKEMLSSGRWFLHHLFEREKTLYKIGEKIAKKQREFLSDPQGKLIPWTMKELAETLELSPSTIVRAISGKYMESPRGVLLLRDLFTVGIQTEKGSISNSDVKKLIGELIENEESSAPLSDDEIASILKNRGISLARRTVAKYRDLLGIPSSLRRKC